MNAIVRRHQSTPRPILPTNLIGVAAICLFFSLCGRLTSAEETGNDNTDDFSVPTSVAFSSNGKVMAVGITTLTEGKRGELQIVDVKTGRGLSRIRFSQTYIIIAATAISPNERFIAAGAGAMDGSGEWFVFDRQTKRISKQFPRRKEYAYSLAVSHDSTLLATAAAGSKEAAIHVRRVIDGKTVARYNLTEAKQMVSQVAFSPKESILAFAFYDPDPPKAGDLVFWDWKKSQIRRSATELKYPVSHVVFSPDGEFIITGGGPANRIRIPKGPSEMVVWSLDGKRIADLQGLHGEIQSMCFSADGSQLAASGYDLGNPMKIVTWQTMGWKQDKSLTTKARTAAHGLHFRDRNTLLSASSDGLIREWDVPNFRLVGQTDYQGK